MKSSLDEQFRCLVQEPLTSLAERHDLGPIIIILDALDECGTEETRQNLLDVLSVRLAKLPKMFRFLIASRDEPEIRVSISRLDIDERDIQTIMNQQNWTSCGCFNDALSGCPRLRRLSFAIRLARRWNNTAARRSCSGSFHLGIDDHSLHRIWLSRRKVE